MIITRLAGGIGNQMFHYAAARGCQRWENEKIILDTHLLQPLESDIEKIVQRPYALDIFPNLKAEIADDNFYNVLSGKDIFSRIKRKVFKRNTTYGIQSLMEPLVIDKFKSRNIYLEGNFQSEEYFRQIRNKLLDDFLFPELDAKNNKIKNKIFSCEQSLSLHIRRGDYLSISNKKIFSSVNLNYYKQAIKLLLNKIVENKISTFLFTDDIDWAKQNIVDDKLDIEFVDGNFGKDSWKDMYLMSCCKHHIIANSSFSWWGAWLSQQEGITVVPRHWFNPNTYQYDINQIIPSHWLIVDYLLN